MRPPLPGKGPVPRKVHRMGQAHHRPDERSGNRSQSCENTSENEKESAGAANGKRAPDRDARRRNTRQDRPCVARHVWQGGRPLHRMGTGTCIASRLATAGTPLPPISAEVRLFAPRVQRNRSGRAQQPAPPPPPLPSSPCSARQPRSHRQQERPTGAPAAAPPRPGTWSAPLGSARSRAPTRSVNGHPPRPTHSPCANNGKGTEGCGNNGPRCVHKGVVHMQCLPFYHLVTSPDNVPLSYTNTIGHPRNWVLVGISVATVACGPPAATHTNGWGTGLRPATISSREMWAATRARPVPLGSPRSPSRSHRPETRSFGWCPENWGPLD